MPETNPPEGDCGDDVNVDNNPDDIIDNTPGKEEPEE